MGLVLLAAIAILGMGVATGTGVTAIKRRKRKKSSVKLLPAPASSEKAKDKKKRIKKKKKEIAVKFPKLPPRKKKEIKTAKKILDTPIPKTAKGAEIVKRIASLIANPVVKRKSPLIQKAAKKKIEEVKAENISKAKVKKYFKTKPKKGYPYVYRNRKNKKKVFANKRGSKNLRKRKRFQFLKFSKKLATSRQRKQYYALRRAQKALDGPAPVPAEAKREIVKTIVKAEQIKPTPEQAARALAIYTKEGGWQGDKERPSKVVRDCQLHMGIEGADGVIGPGTRARAKSLGALLYRRASQAPKAWATAETF